MMYELVVGLETHVELSTKSKIFCGCTTAFKGEPNTHCCPICIGLPGTMPRLNEGVVCYAVAAGLALNCKIAEFSKMDRKNYVYPDLPKAYQISQHDKPLCYDGHVLLSNGREIGIERIHIEEDAGKLIHQGGATFIDYNRGGVPLIEIVSKPDFRSIDEVVEYLEFLQLTMRYIEVSDCKMQEGSLRCDVNVSVMPKGSDMFGTRTEIKNMNSFNNIRKALQYEMNRQIDILEGGGTVTQQTMRYKAELGITEPMRGKEDAHDYRYFREPDLVNICVSNEQVNSIAAKMPELFSSKLNRYVNEYNIPVEDARLLAEYKNVANFFEDSVERVKSEKSYKNCANLILSVIFSKFNSEEEKEKFNINVSSSEMFKLLSLQEEKKISNNMAKKTLEKMLETGSRVCDIISEADLEGITEDKLLEICNLALSENEKAAKDYLSGKDRAIKSLVGFVMKQTKGRADAVLAENILKGIIAEKFRM